MEKGVFRMMPRPGMAEEYRRRHGALWPELAALLKAAGFADYSIHLDSDTHALFRVMWRRADHGMDSEPRHPAMQRWRAHMAGIMAAIPDSPPAAVPLVPMFHLP